MNIFDKIEKGDFYFKPCEVFLNKRELRLYKIYKDHNELIQLATLLSSKNSNSDVDYFIKTCKRNQDDNDDQLDENLEKMLITIIESFNIIDTTFLDLIPTNSVKCIIPKDIKIPTPFSKWVLLQTKYSKNKTLIEFAKKASELSKENELNYMSFCRYIVSKLNIQESLNENVLSFSNFLK